MGARVGSMRAALLNGGAVVFDASGELSFGLSDESLSGLVGDAPDFLRLAVAHLAAARAVETGLVETERAYPEAARAGDGDAQASERREPLALEVPLRVIRSPAFLGAYLMSASLRSRKEGVAAIPLVESSGRSFVGPILSPDGSPCILCLRRAVSPNRKSETILMEAEDSGCHSSLSEAEASRLVRENAVDPWREILEVNTDGQIVARHHVRSDPACRVCGNGAVDRNGAYPRLESRAASASLDTGSRVCCPQETFDAYRHLISPVSGAVRRIRRVETSAPELVQVYTACHAMSDYSRSFAAVMRDGRDHSGGKGGSAAQARTSALCEALERFSAVASGGEVDVVGRFADVAGAIHPAEVQRFSDAQYAGRRSWNRAASRFQYVPEPFDENAEVAWSRVWCLQTREAAYLPTSLLYFDFQGSGAKYGTADSNGLAAGRTLEEAVLQGFLELVERDAIAIWWYNRLSMPRIDVESFGDTYVNDVLAHYRALGRCPWVLDLTTDLGIPVFAAISALEGAERPEIIFGFGAHLDPAVALRRCVTEMNQMLATVERPAEQRTAQLGGAFDDALRWWKEATLEDNPYVVPSAEVGRRGRGSFGCASSTDLKRDIETCLATASRHGLSVYVRDLTRADLGLPVARVVVPGLRHFWRRLAPGRLFDAPVAMGQLTEPLSEADLNPISLFV